jgi:hypothetical protein
MNELPVTQGVACFESASELREAHARLLDALDHELGVDGSATAEAAALSRMEPAIRAFLERGAATGVYLEEMKERTACQVLLDYWVSSLAQAAMGAPPARLAAFDGGRLPDLKDKPCPYVGLDAFRGREFFFGRESDTQALVEQIRRTPLVVVLGASGSGKSSLVMGGVLPALAADQVEPDLRIAPTFVPGNTVFARLAEAMLPMSGQAGESANAAADRLKSEPGHLRELAGGADGAPILMTIDQFEEVFTLAGPEDREALAAGLASLLEPDRGHRVLLTMREEFRSRLVELRALARFLDKAWYSMRPMGYEELRAAVERPAALVNLQFQSGIVDDLVKKVLGQPAALPLLQFTLRQLWDRRDRNRVTWEVYRKVGDPLAALQTSADAFYDALAPQTQDEARRILLELVRVDELLEAYRQPVPKSRLLQAGRANTEDVLRVLAQHDYLRISDGAAGGDPIVEVKHESLIRNWPRLVTWIDEKRIERRQRIALTQAAHRWSHSGRPSEGLLTGWYLEEAKRQGDMSDLEREFVEASAQQVDRAQREREQALRREAERARRRGVMTSLAAVVLAVLLVLTAIACWREVKQTQLAVEQTQLAMANARKAEDRLAELTLLARYGWLGSPDEAAIAGATRANAAIQRVLAATTPEDRARRERTPIEIFYKDIDQKKVETAFAELGFPLRRPRALVPGIATNAVWFGSVVPPEDVKLVALALIRAGVQIRAIRPIQTYIVHKKDARLIQVGADTAMVDAPAYSVEQVVEASVFTR